MADPCLCCLPCVSDSTNETSREIPGLVPTCTVTCAIAKQVEEQFSLLVDDQARLLTYLILFLLLTMCRRIFLQGDQEDDGNLKMSNKLIEHQKSDPELVQLLQDALCESEATKVPICF